MISGRITLKNEEFEDYYEVMNFAQYAMKTKTDIYEVINLNSLIENSQFGKPIAALVAKDAVFEDLKRHGIEVLRLLDNGKVGYPYGYSQLHMRATYFEEVLSKEVREAINHSSYTQKEAV